MSHVTFIWCCWCSFPYSVP